MRRAALIAALLLSACGDGVGILGLGKESKPDEGRKAPVEDPVVDDGTAPVDWGELEHDESVAKPPVFAEARFKAVWLEPLALAIGRKSSPISGEDLRQVVRRLRRGLGFEIAVIAYAEFLDCFLYAPLGDYAFVSYDVKSSTEVATKTVEAKNPAHRCPLVEGGTFLDVFLDEAAKVGLAVYLGLSRTGDLHLLNDVENSLRGNTAGIMLPGVPLADRLDAAVFYTKAIADDLAQQLGTSPALKGWYLTHETSCLDVGMNYYRPVGLHLKSAYPDKQVLVSPTVDSRVCFAEGGYADLLRANADAIDVYAYQDTVGAGSLKTDGVVQNHFTDAARQQRLAELQAGRLQELAAAHEASDTAFWMNAEVWEMDGTCPLGVGGYGCPYPGPSARALQQLDAYRGVASVVMLNEGLLAFDLGVEALERVSPTEAAQAREMTRAYRARVTGP